MSETLEQASDTELISAGAEARPIEGGLRLPPGPRLPKVVQTAGFIFGGVSFLEALRRRYGGAVRMTTLFDEGFVMVFDPDLVKALFQGPAENLSAGEANALDQIGQAHQRTARSREALAYFTEAQLL